MELKIRTGTPADAEACGTICYNAFKTISEAHGFTPDFPATEVAIDVLKQMLANPKFYSVIAEVDGRIVGSNFLDERNPIAGVGPITVDPTVQNRAIGRRLMNAVHERAAHRNFAGVRLIQAGFHTRSLSLCAKLEYDVREHLACMQGKALGISIEGHVVRTATEADIYNCNRLCQQGRCFASIGALAICFENFRNFPNGVPIAVCGGHAKELLDLSEVTDGFHLSSIKPENESVLDRDNFEHPVVICRQIERKRR
jgi:predicted N-acetyltransferase YhbS